LVVPVVRGERITAVIGVGNKPWDYEDQDVEIMTRLADVSWDIAERKETQEALQEAEERYRTLFEGAGDAILIMRGDHSIYS
jgi:PAS domain-containing protein